jgi:ribonuclease HI
MGKKKKRFKQSKRIVRPNMDYQLTDHKINPKVCYLFMDAGYNYGSNFGKCSYVMLYENRITKWSMNFMNTTANELELVVMLNAMTFVYNERIRNIVIVSNSEYALSAVSYYAHKWVINGWKTSNGSVKYQKLIQDIIKQAHQFETVQYYWTRSKGTCVYSNIANQLGRDSKEIRTYPTEENKGPDTVQIAFRYFHNVDDFKPQINRIKKLEIKEEAKKEAPKYRHSFELVQRDDGTSYKRVVEHLVN